MQVQINIEIHVPCVVLKSRMYGNGGNDGQRTFGT
jgi:hypothetical protein